MFECYALSSPQINNGPFHFECEKRKQKNMQHVTEKECKNNKERKKREVTMLYTGNLSTSMEWKEGGKKKRRFREGNK